MAPSSAAAVKAAMPAGRAAPRACSRPAAGPACSGVETDGRGDSEVRFASPSTPPVSHADVEKLEGGRLMREPAEGRGS